MKSARLSARLVFATVAASTLWLPSAQAEGSLLWKATSAIPATVVPTYTNQVSPFPVTFVKPPKDEIDEAAVSEAIAVRQRLRDEAYERADKMLRSGSGFEPLLTGLRVGGVLEGNLGRRVLIRNQWLGVGSEVVVRQIRTRELIDALRALHEYDPSTAASMAGEVDGMLANNATVKLKVKSVSSKSLELTAPSGRAFTLPVNVDGR